MIELLAEALNKIEIGVIILNKKHKIVFWNNYIEKLSDIKSNNALNKNIEDTVPIFKKSLYQNILMTVLIKNQIRFCSSKIHKGFIFMDDKEHPNIRQNMKIEPIVIDDEVYALIQINDISDQVIKEGQLTSLINELQKGFTEIAKTEEMHKRLAEIDSLTGVLNRRGITQKLDSIIINGSNLNNYSLLFLDLDEFKYVNDNYGHIIGDKLLTHITEIMKEIVGKNNYIARLGGDEFLILLNSINCSDDSLTIANKLVFEISKPILIDNCNINTSASIGIFILDDSVHNSTEIIKRADSAMYDAKHSGKNRVNIYSNLSKFNNV